MRMRQFFFKEETIKVLRLFYCIVLIYHNEMASFKTWLGVNYNYSLYEKEIFFKKIRRMRIWDAVFFLSFLAGKFAKVNQGHVRWCNIHVNEEIKCVKFFNKSRMSINWNLVC